MGMREIKRFLEQREMDVRDVRRRLLLAPTPRERDLREAQEVVRPPAAGTRVEGHGHGGGSGRGSPHHWPVGRRLRPGWACRLDFRAVEGFPPPSVRRSSRYRKLQQGRASDWPIGTGRWCTGLCWSGSASA